MLDITDFIVTGAARQDDTPAPGPFRTAKFYGTTDARRNVCSFCGKSFQERSPECNVWPEDHGES